MNTKCIHNIFNGVVMNEVLFARLRCISDTKLVQLTDYESMMFLEWPVDLAALHQGTHFGKSQWRHMTVGGTESAISLTDCYPFKLLTYLP